MALSRATRQAAKTNDVLVIIVVVVYGCVRSQCSEDMLCAQERGDGATFLASFRLLRHAKERCCLGTEIVEQEYNDQGFPPDHCFITKSKRPKNV